MVSNYILVECPWLYSVLLSYRGGRSFESHSTKAEHIIKRSTKFGFNESTIGLKNRDFLSYIIVVHRWNFENWSDGSNLPVIFRFLIYLIAILSVANSLSVTDCHWVFVTQQEVSKKCLFEKVNRLTRIWYPALSKTELPQFEWLWSREREQTYGWARILPDYCHGRYFNVIFRTELSFIRRELFCISGTEIESIVFSQ